MLGHVFEEQDAAAHLGHVRRAQQRHQRGQVAAPQHTAAVEGIGVARLEAEDLQLAAHDLAKQRHGQFIGFRQPEVAHGGRAAVADRAGLGQQGQVEGGEIAHADETLAAVGHGAPVDHGQQADQAVAAAGGHHDGMLLLDRPLQAGRALLVGAGEALVHRQRGAVDLGLEPLGGQPLAGQFQLGRVAHRRRRRYQVNAAGLRRRVDAARVADMARFVAVMLVVVVPVGGRRVFLLGHTGDSLARRARKKPRSNSPQGSASTPPVMVV